MANINLSRAYKTASFDGFPGIDRTARSAGGVGVADLKNFRIEADGSLSKRCGFAPLLELPEGKLRAIHAVSDARIFALIENKLYELDLTLNTCSLKATLTESDTDACFFYYDNNLHLIDGTELYAYDGTEFKAVYGYVPLYGKEWHPSTKGEVYEPINAFSPCLRVSYRIDSTETETLELPFEGESLQLALVNGVAAGTYMFRIASSNHSQISMTKTYAVGDVIEIFYTPSTEKIAEARAKAVAHTKAATFGVGSGGASTSFLALYGGENKSELYVSRYVETDSFALAKSVYSDISPLYVVVEDAISTDQGKNGITATCRSGSRLAVFTDDATYMLGVSNEHSMQLIPVSHTEGCSVKDGAIPFENSPVTFSGKEILIWTPSTLYDDEYIAKSISSPVSELMTSVSSVGSAAYFKSKNEIWFYRSGDTRIWIYNTLHKCWYSFDGFTPDLMLELGEKMVFLSGTTLYGFSDELSYDVGESGEKPIRAMLQSSLIDFGTINRKKRLSRVFISLSPEAEVLLAISDANGNEIASFLRDKKGEAVGYCESRMPCKRSRYYSFNLSHSGGALKIYSMTLIAVK